MDCVHFLYRFLCVWLGVAVFFFFQAEDGIRDLVRSRGLGDVYKRQVDGSSGSGIAGRRRNFDHELVGPARHRRCRHVVPVSYTHLTLPTSDLV